MGRSPYFRRVCKVRESNFMKLEKERYGVFYFAKFDFEGPHISLEIVSKVQNIMFEASQLNEKS